MMDNRKYISEFRPGYICLCYHRDISPFKHILDSWSFDFLEIPIYQSKNENIYFSIFFRNSQMTFDLPFPKIIFCVYLSSIKFKGYDLKNVPSTTGRADVIARILMNALFGPKQLNYDVGVWVLYNKKFLAELRDFFIIKGISYNLPAEFSTLIDSNANFFKNNPGQTSFSEQKILHVLYKSFENITNPDFQNSIITSVIPLSATSSLIEKMESERKIFVLFEDTPLDLLKNQDLLCSKQGKFLFFIGDQLGLENIFELSLEKYKKVSLGFQSQLASNIILLIRYLVSLP